MSLPVFPRLTPADLAGVDNGRLPDHLLVTVEMHGADARCHPQFARALRALMHDCRAATGVDLTNVGHYRSIRQPGRPAASSATSRAAAGTRFWDGSWWRRVTGAPVATPGRSDHGWGLAIDGAVWDHDAGQAVARVRLGGVGLDPRAPHAVRTVLGVGRRARGAVALAPLRDRRSRRARLRSRQSEPPAAPAPEPPEPVAISAPSRRSTRPSGATGCTR